MSASLRPSLKIVKPGRKCAISENLEDFLGCIEQNLSNNSRIIQRVGDGIFYIDNVLSPGECEDLCKVVDSHASLGFWSPLGRGNEQSRMFRDADTIEIKSHTIANEIWTRLSIAIEEELRIIVANNEFDPNWERELVGTWHASSLNHDLLFAKYPPFGAFAPHTDGRAIHDFNIRSFYSVIIFLNTISRGCGGGTRFYRGDAVSQLKTSINLEGKQFWTSDPSLMNAEVDALAGRMLIFHQALVHEGVPPLAPHCKYIIRSDVMCSRSPALCNSTSDREAYALFQKAEDLAEEGKVEEAIPLFKRAFKLSPEMARIMGQG